MSYPLSGCNQSQMPGRNHNPPQLRYLSNASQSHEQEPPQESGIPVIDFVNQLCYSMGLDAAIFTEQKEEAEHDKAFVAGEEHSPEVEDVKRLISAMRHLRRTDTESPFGPARGSPEGVSASLPKFTFSKGAASRSLLSPRGGHLAH